MAFTDDFNRADSAAVGNGWIERIDAKWEILGNQLRYLGGADYRDAQCLRPASENFADGTISVEFTRSATDQSPQVHGRFTTNYFYAAWVMYGVLYLSKVLNRTKTDLGSLSGLTISNGIAYKLSLIMSGTTITAQLRRVSDGALLGEVIRTDSSITNAGQHGVTGGAAASVIVFDNYSSALTIDATKSVNDDGAGVDSVSAADSSGAKSLADNSIATESVGVIASVPAFETGQADDSVSILVSVSVADSGAGADIPLIVEPSMLTLVERFDGTLDSWTLDVSGGSVQIQTVNNDEKLILVDTSASALVSATRSIEGQSAPFCVEVDIYAATGAVGLLEALDASGSVIFSIKADALSGLATFDTDNDAASTFALTASQYYQIVFYCDTLSDTVRAWYMTGSGAAPSVWTAIGGAKSYSGSLVSKIRLATDAAATGEVRFDEVKVFRPNVFCIGDSNTAGYASSVSYWNPSPAAPQRVGINEDETHSYPHWLGLEYSPVQLVANRGLNSDQSSHIDARIQSDVIDQGAQTVVILVGTNDITAGVALATIEANIQSAANKAAASGLTVCLASVPPKNDWNSTQNAKRASLNAWLQSHSSANNYRFADVYNAVKNPFNPDQIDPACDSGDGLHFTTHGLQVIADTVYSALLETKTIIETAIGADSIEVRNSVLLAEGGAGLDSLALSNFIALSDSGVASESLEVFAAIQLLELAASVEGLLAGGALELKAVADTGAGADSVSAIIREGATLQDIYDLTLTRLSASSYVRPDNEGISSLLSHAVAMSKWKNNKLGRTHVAGKVETWVLYDDDGATPLLTWTHDTSTRTRNRAL
ncbi:MAG: hypothetical protein IT362_10085 [Deltaproteobacteria bacterium]|nr:hypothetical protein [Deltaproteobacteria bacterium]